VLLDIDLGPERALDFIVAAKVGGFNPDPGGHRGTDQEAISDPGGRGRHPPQTTFDESLCSAIRQIARGEVCLEESTSGPCSFGGPLASGDRSKLTNRDRTVLRFILQGLHESRDRRAAGGIGRCGEGFPPAVGKLEVRTRAQL